MLKNIYLLNNFHSQLAAYPSMYHTSGFSGACLHMSYSVLVSQRYTQFAYAVGMYLFIVLHVVHMYRSFYFGDSTYWLVI